MYAAASRTVSVVLIDDQMPRWERRVLKARIVEAPPDVTYDAIRAVNFFDSPVIALPNRTRTGFDRVWSRSSPAHTQPVSFGFDQLLEEDGGFHLVAEEPGRELVLGFIGRWWERGYGRVSWAPEQFRHFDGPGYAVGAWGFSVFGYGADTSVLVTDVRVRCTDEAARRRFRAYWTVVGPFVTAMARPVLGLVAREAERGSNPRAANGER